MTNDYPARPRFFANRFCRLLTKAAVAQDITPEACWLLTVIAHQEDVCRYRRAVTFWNGQLLPLCGFGSERRLIAARQKAIDSGWLHYDAGGKGKIAKYWVTIPPGFESLADSPVDEGQFLTDETQVKAQVQTQAKRSATVRHSNLSLNAKPKKKRFSYSELVPNSCTTGGSI